MGPRTRLVRLLFIVFMLPGMFFTLLITMTSQDVSVRASAATPSELTDSQVTKARVIHSKVTLVSIPGLSFLELQPHYLENMPHLQALIADGAIGAMNIRAPERGLEDTYLSISSSAPASTFSTQQAWRQDERTEAGTIQEQYARYQGDLAGSHELIIPDYTSMKQANSHMGSRGEIGSFGKALQDNKIQTYVYGDLRQAPFMLMDDRGLVEHGLVGKRLTIADPYKASGVTTNYEKLLTLWQASRSPGVIVLELGNLLRLYEEQQRYDPDIFERSKVEVLREIDNFIGILSRGLQPTDQLWIFSPWVNPEAWTSKWMFSPLLMLNSDVGKVSNKGVNGEQLLYSPSTHRQGIVAMYDLAPTILRQFNLEQPVEMVGMPLQAVSAENAMPQLMLMNKEAAQVYKLRPQLLYPFVIYQIIVLLISLLLVLLQWSNSYRIMALPLYSLLISPFTMLLMGWLVRLGWSSQELVVFFILFLFTSAWIATRFHVYGSLIVICALTVILLFIDGFTGNLAMRSSVLGYDPMFGARYYGVGNEYMGVWIGAAILGVAGSMYYWRESKLAVVGSGLLFLGILYYMASPVWGTNAGGALTAGAAFGIAWLRLFSKRMRLQIQWGKLLMWIMIFVGMALVGLWLLNAGFRASSETDSHIGRAMDALFAGNFDLIRGVIWRKLAMNIHLIGVSVWSKALLASLLVMAVLLLKPAGLFRRWQEAHGSLMHGLSANASGAIVALIVNDSGIVAAATMMVFVAIPMLLIRLQELRTTTETESVYSIGHTP